MNQFWHGEQVMICRHSGFMTCLTIDLFHHLTIQDSSRGNVKVMHILLVHIIWVTVLSMAYCEWNANKKYILLVWIFNMHKKDLTLLCSIIEFLLLGMCLIQENIIWCEILKLHFMLHISKFHKKKMCELFSLWRGAVRKLAPTPN